MVQKILSWMGEGVYLGFLPCEVHTGAKRHLLDLWKTAPKKVAWTQTLLALIVCLSPPLLIGKFRLFPNLSQPDKEKALQKMLASPLYLFRMVAYGVRGQACIAVLRDKEARKSLLGSQASSSVNAVRFHPVEERTPEITL